MFKLKCCHCLSFQHLQLLFYGVIPIYGDYFFLFIAIFKNCVLFESKVFVVKLEEKERKGEDHYFSTTFIKSVSLSNDYCPWRGAFYASY
jgi:hypothetical protein